MSQSKPASLSKRTEMLLVALCLSVFVALCAMSIGRFSIWHDEGYTYTLIESSYSGIIERTGLDVHPPLYYVALKAWSTVFGDGIVALRSFSALTMLGAIAITWWLLRRLVGQNKALFALAAMAIGPFLVRYGIEMRMYGLAALLAALATMLYLQFSEMKKGGIRWQMIVYGVVVLLGIYTQYFMVLVPLVHVVHALYAARGSLIDRCKDVFVKFWVAGAVAIAGFLPWLPTAISQFRETHGAFWIGPVSVETLTSTPQALLLLKTQNELSGWAGFAGVVVIATVAVALAGLVRSRLQHEVKWILIDATLVPPVALFLLSLPPLQPSYQDRYMSFFAPLFYSMMAVGLLSLAHRRARIASLSVLFVLLSIGQVMQYQEGNNHGWWEKPTFTMRELLEQVDDDAPLYATSLWTFFDMHSTVQDGGAFDGANSTQLLLEIYPERWTGNYSAVYERPELITLGVPNNDTFWLIDESGASQLNGVLSADLEAQYTSIVSYQAGYAKLTKYRK